MRASLTMAPAGRGDPVPAARGGRAAAVMLSLVPEAPAVAMLRRSPGGFGLDQARRPPQARVPSRSRLVFRAGVVRAG
jgi:hypothetical protein